MNSWAPSSSIRPCPRELPCTRPRESAHNQRPNPRLQRDCESARDPASATQRARSSEHDPASARDAEPRERERDFSVRTHTPEPAPPPYISSSARPRLPPLLPARAGNFQKKGVFSPGSGPFSFSWRVVLLLLGWRRCYSLGGWGPLSAFL